MPTRADVLREVRRARRHRQTVRATALLILIIALVVGGALFLNHYFLITKIEVSGTKSVPVEKIILKTNEVLAGHDYYLLPRRSYFFHPTRDLEDILASSFPRLAIVSLSKPNWNTLHLSVSERTPAFIVCRLTKCFYIDQNGRLFAEAPSFSGSPLLIIEAPTGSNLALGLDFGPREALAWISRFTTLLETVLAKSPFQGERAVSVSFGEDQDLKFVVRNPSQLSSAWTLIVSRRDAPEVSLENLAAALGSDTFKQELVKHQAQLDYLDLRFGRKVFYKFLTEPISDIIEP